ncbi:MAG: hypothetical protein KatS3mg014_0020 [Actinomycetota bacterium]|nr:MAG: hypothetical protein KatS3mg014_0020 [Actinomycetota bacterium]
MSPGTREGDVKLRGPTAATGRYMPDGGRSLSRRELLRYASIGAVGLWLAAVLPACGGEGAEEQAAGPGTSPVGPGTSPEESCPPDGIAIGASPGAAANGFDRTELVAPAGRPFTICFDNTDTGVPHNFAAYTEQGGDLLGRTEIQSGPVFQTLRLGPLEAGEYWYQCDVHPTTMTGRLIVS